MVCVPCIVIPVLLWIWHKFIQPWVMKYWNPRGKKEITEIDTKNVDKSSEEYQYIAGMIKQHPVMMFSKEGCRFCSMAREVLDGIGVKYHDEDIGKKENCQPLQDVFKQLTGERTVPRVFVGGKCIGGGSETWTVHNEGRLVPMLHDAGAVFQKQDKKKQ